MGSSRKKPKRGEIVKNRQYLIDIPIAVAKYPGKYQGWLEERPGEVTSHLLTMQIAAPVKYNWERLRPAKLAALW